MAGAAAWSQQQGPELQGKANMSNLKLGLEPSPRSVPRLVEERSKQQAASGRARTCVVVFEEGDGAGGPHAQHAGRLALPVD